MTTAPKPGLQRRQALALIPAATLLPGLVACGGGDGERPAPPPERPGPRPLGVGGEGTGRMQRLAWGAVSGLSSVWVAGLRFDDSHARLWREVDPRAPEPRPLSELRLGMSLQVLADDLQAQDIRLAPEVVGAVQRVVDEGRVLVAGQTVLVNVAPAAPTLFDGLRELDELLPGDRVEVHGLRDARGRIRATRLARFDGPAVVRVLGRVSQSDAQLRTLSIGGLLVDLRDATLTGFASWPAVGQTVVVFGAAGPQPHRLAASVVQRRDPVLAEGQPMQLAGPIGAWRSVASFDVGPITVDASAQPAAVVAELAAGRLVELAGTLRQGLLRAEALRVFDDDEPLRTTLVAAAAGHLGPARFSLRGHAVEAAQAHFEGLSAANLADGVPLQVIGEVDSLGVQATSVALAAPAEGEVFVLAGIVDDLDATQGHFVLQGLPLRLRLGQPVVFDGGAATLLADGVAVRARGAVQGGEFVVQTLSYGLGETLVEIAGLAGNVEADGPSGGAFEIGSDDCIWDVATRFVGSTNTPADLVNGRLLRVRGRREATVIRAVEVDARATLPGQVRLRGTVSGYVSLAEFVIDGQRIDARTAVFDPPALAESLAGAWVDVEGSLRDGVLVAARVAEP